ncbi:MAG: hypothetical protein JW940_28785 [Polyangiaceae bacterium]|nr:hypothetical protein [Polyangiaceae bacterium]
MSVSLDHVILAARSGTASLAAELCGYIVLGAADRVVRAPCQLFTSGVELGSEGEVRISSGRAAEEIAAEGSLRRLLSQLLQAARSGSPALERASRRPVGHGVAAFIGEIEAALVPVNRGAARRALARLHREAMRAPLPAVPDPPDRCAGLPSSQMEVRAGGGARVADAQLARRQVLSARELAVPPAVVDEQPSEPSQPASPVPDEAEPSSSERTDPMDTGYGSLPRSNHGRLAGEVKRRETPRLGSIAVGVPRVEQDERERPSWSGGTFHVEVDDLGDETPLFSRGEREPNALPQPGTPASRLPAAETVAVPPPESDEADDGQQVHGRSVLPTIPPPDLSVPAADRPVARGSVAPVSRLETLVEGFSAAECRSVRELCRELQQIAGLEGREGQSSLPPPATKDKGP